MQIKLLPFTRGNKILQTTSQMLSWAPGLQVISILKTHQADREQNRRGITCEKSHFHISRSSKRNYMSRVHYRKDEGLFFNYVGNVNEREYLGDMWTGPYLGGMWPPPPPSSPGSTLGPGLALDPPPNKLQV